jgi:hypothetical protein
VLTSSALQPAEQPPKGKDKIVPVLFLIEHHAMKAYWGNGVIAALIP